MIEARGGYYEASRYTLQALQKMQNEKFPLSEYLCDLEPTIDAPTYIQQSPYMDLSILFPKQRESVQNVDVLQDWPIASDEILDSSQSCALRQMLSKKLSIIQGPPGTGKTYVSVLALRILLQKLAGQNSPIIVAAQTNPRSAATYGLSI